MRQNMSMFGIGPKLAVAALPYLILTIFLTLRYPKLFGMEFIPRTITIYLGVTILLVGAIFYINTVKVFLREFGKGNLIKTGTYSLCRNPLYAAFIVFLIPAIALFFNSWLILTTSATAYMAFKVLIHNEYDYLKGKFGSEYREYVRNVNEIFPIPRINKKVS